MTQLPSPNKALIHEVFRGLERGDASLFLAAMADDVSYSIIGSTLYSGTVVGKKKLLDGLFTAISSRLSGPSALSLDLLVAEGDHVIATGRGSAVTRDGTPYNNVYCWVFKLHEGRIIQVTEYLDTELITKTFSEPELP